MGAPVMVGSASAGAHPTATEPRAAAGSRIGLLITLMVFGTLVAANLIGLPYFLLSAAERVRSPLHPWFRPSGLVGQSAGILAFALFLFLWLYPLRKKFPRLAFSGSLAAWLNVHVIVGLMIPLLAALHAAWHFTGLIGLGYGAMMVAWLSGIVGRYIYARIPRGKSGVELTRDEVEAQRAAILQQIIDATGIEPEVLVGIVLAETSPSVPADASPLRAMAAMIANDARRWRAVRKIRWESQGTTAAERRVERQLLVTLRRLMRREIALTQQARMLDATHRLFQYWHVAHKPMAITALLAVVLHVATAIALGVTWFR